MFRRNLVPVWLGILVLSGMFLMGQEGWNPPPPPTEVSVSILVQVDPLYPTEFDGLVAGDPVPYAEVQVSRGGEVVASGFTNSEGGVVFELREQETYAVDVVADTTEPDCWWKEHSFFYLSGPRDITLDVWTDGPGCVGPPVEVSILVRVDPLYPGGFDGLVAGDPVPNAEVEITNQTSGEVVASGITDGSGEVLLEVPGISRYYISARADTSDPYCMWGGFIDVVVGTMPFDGTLDLWVICE